MNRLSTVVGAAGCCVSVVCGRFFPWCPNPLCACVLHASAIPYQHPCSLITPAHRPDHTQSIILHRGRQAGAGAGAAGKEPTAAALILAAGGCLLARGGESQPWYVWMHVRVEGTRQASASIEPRRIGGQRRRHACRHTHTHADDRRDAALPSPIDRCLLTLIPHPQPSTTQNGSRRASA